MEGQQLRWRRGGVSLCEDAGSWGRHLPRWVYNAGSPTLCSAEPAPHPSADCSLFRLKGGRVGSACKTPRSPARREGGTQRYART